MCLRSLHWSFPHFSQVFSTCLRQLSGVPWSLPRLLFPQSLGRGGDPRQLAGEDVCENFEIMSTLSLFWALTRIFLNFLFLCVLVYVRVAELGSLSSGAKSVYLQFLRQMCLHILF